MTDQRGEERRAHEHARYWRHNTGPAPISNLPVTVHVTPSHLRLAPGATGQVRITVTCSGAPARGRVEFTEYQSWDYVLAPGAFTEFTGEVTARPGRRDHGAGHGRRGSHRTARRALVGAPAGGCPRQTALLPHDPRDGAMTPAASGRPRLGPA
ncbi:hypothetical protein SAMN04488074_107314 [Lentzea albidocapillata subsp. violacea]|uniref:Uncharacterized protein n=1 Tax=Lentzea albidocapillata subsp. violacea TaxID=128104 RepID=A0A1G9FC36_9PSEU|nr:hypothetical protein [Lentzea albidocapillata]SDK85942.1 hypothetical protein SAMN04488074_107314 [Lentzea albidocapillata subsp. violacea]